jgi:hypothetical protein
MPVFLCFNLDFSRRCLPLCRYQYLLAARWVAVVLKILRRLNLDDGEVGSSLYLRRLDVFVND